MAGSEFFRFILFIIIITAFVQLVEMAIDRYAPKIVSAAGDFSPLITVNAHSGVSLFMVIRKYSFLVTLGYGLAAG